MRACASAECAVSNASHAAAASAASASPVRRARISQRPRAWRGSARSRAEEIHQPRRGTHEGNQILGGAQSLRRRPLVLFLGGGSLGPASAGLPGVAPSHAVESMTGCSRSCADRQALRMRAHQRRCPTRLRARGCRRRTCAVPPSCGDGSHLRTLRERTLEFDFVVEECCQRVSLARFAAPRARRRGPGRPGGARPRPRGGRARACGRHAPPR